VTNAHRLVGAVLVVGAAAWGSGLLFPSPEAEIRRQLDALAEAASVAPGQTNLERMARAARLGRFVTEDVVIDLGGRLRAARGREAVVGVAARAPVGADGVAFQFLDERIVLAGDAVSATVAVTVRGTGVSLATGDEWVDAIELDMRWREVADEWLIASVTAVEAIRRRERR
jgi:hypothetical protein